MKEVQIQLLRQANLSKIYALHASRKIQHQDGEELEKCVPEARIVSEAGPSTKPFREIPEPFQHRLKDYDVPSLTNCSSRGSRTPSLVTVDDAPISLGVSSPIEDNLWQG
jgi:hypothetical protein